MLDHVTTNLRVATALNVLAGYLAVIAVRGYPPPLLFIPLVVLVFAKRGEEMHLRHPLYRKISFGLTVAACFGVLASLMVLSPVAALVVLFMYIQCHLLMHRKEKKHYYYIYMMTLFLVLAAAVQSPEPIIAIALFMFVVSSAWALSSLLLTTDPHGVREHAAPEVVSTRLRAGVTQEVTSSRAPMIGLVGLCAAIIIGLTSFFFVVTPRVEAGFLGRDITMVRITGMPQTVDLQGGTYVRQDPTPVMQVEFPGEEAANFPVGDMYWRVATLTAYYNSSWSRKGLDDHYYRGVDPLFADSMAEFRRAMHSNPHEVTRSRLPGEHRLVQQRIFSDQMPDEGIPCLDLPLRIQVEGRAADKQVLWDGRNDVSARVSRGKDNQLDYTVWSEIPTPDLELLRESPMTYESISPDDLQTLTYHDLFQRTQDLAAEITAEADNPFDKALAVRNYFSGNGFVYTLNLPIMPPDHAIDAFITEIKAGHCEFYASAMALMLRSLGIPTRVVSGYRGGEWNATLNAFIVRQSMAHLWVEVYFEGYGWVRFDPAPPSAEGEELTTMMAIVQRLIDLQLRAKLFWFREVISFDRAAQIERLKALPQGLFRSLGLQRQFDEATMEEGGSTGSGLAGAAAVIVVAVGVVGGVVVLMRRGKPAYPLTKEQKQAVHLYNQLRRRLAQAGVSVAGMSAEELEAEVASRGWPEAPQIEEMLRLYNEVRFGQRPMQRGRMEALLRGLRRLQPRAAG